MMNRTAALTLTVCLLAASATAQQCPPAGPSNWCSGAYQYDGIGNIKAIGADTYLYDALGRLTSGTADVQRTGIPSRQTYTYDPFGNRTNVSRDAGSVNCIGGCEIPVVVDAATNHITSNAAHYGEAGNLDFIQATVGNATYSASYTYDAEGSLARANSTDDREFIYTADDERLASKNGVTWTWTLRGLDYKVLRAYTSLEVNGQPTANLQWFKDYVWRDNLLLASVSPITPGSSTTSIQHFHLDHLGTPRVVTNLSGGFVGVHAFYPFGAELELLPSESNTELLKFTGHERDRLPGGPLSLDNMHARYGFATLGRFLSPDPIPGTPGDSQSWNRYLYVLDNPLNLTDPTGEHCERKDGKPCIELSISVGAKAPSEAERKRDEVLQIAGDTLDGSAFTIFEKSGVGNIMTGFYNDSPSQVAKGVGQEIMWASAGATNAGGSVATTRVFWSGGREVAGEAAAMYASSIGGKTLEMTLTGRALTWATEHFGYEAVRPLWNLASRQFAASASGEVVAVHGTSVAIGSTWARIEFGALTKNTAVVGIRYFVVVGGKLVGVP